MVRKWKRTLIKTAAWAGMALAPVAAAHAAAPVGTTGQVITVSEAGKPDQKCVILQTWITADGTSAYKAQDVTTGEIITILGKGPVESAPGAGPDNSLRARLRSMRSRIFHWGRNQEPPMGSPVPPEMVLETTAPAPAATGATPSTTQYLSQPLYPPVPTGTGQQIIADSTPANGPGVTIIEGPGSEQLAGKGAKPGEKKTSPPATTVQTVEMTPSTPAVKGPPLAQAAATGDFRESWGNPLDPGTKGTSELPQAVAQGPDPLQEPEKYGQHPEGSLPTTPAAAASQPGYISSANAGKVMAPANSAAPPAPAPKERWHLFAGLRSFFRPKPPQATPAPMTPPPETKVVVEAAKPPQAEKIDLAKAPEASKVEPAQPPKPQPEEKMAAAKKKPEGDKFVPVDLDRDPEPVKVAVKKAPKKTFQAKKPKVSEDAPAADEGPALGAASVLAAANGSKGPTRYVPVPVVTLPGSTKPPLPVVPQPPPPQLPSAPDPTAKERGMWANAFTPPQDPNPPAFGPMPQPYGYPTMPYGMYPGYGYGPMRQPMLPPTPYGPPPMQQQTANMGQPMNPYLAANMYAGRPMYPQGMYGYPAMPQGMASANGMYPAAPQGMSSQPGLNRPGLAQAAAGKPGVSGQGVVPVAYRTGTTQPAAAQPQAQAPAQQPSGYPDHGELLISQRLGVLQNSLYPSQREWAVDSLAGCDCWTHPHVVQALTRAAAKDPAGTVRAACVHALAKMKAATPAVVKTIRGLKDDSDPRVRDEVKQALAVLTPPARGK
jgi:hypothetical protein